MPYVLPVSTFLPSDELLVFKGTLFLRQRFVWILCQEGVNVH